MSQGLSLDLRRRVVSAYGSGEGTYAEVAQRFGVGVASVSRWLRQYREHGAVVPGRHGGGRRCRVDEAGLQVLQELVSRHPDATLQELSAKWHQEQGVLLARSVIGRALERAGLSRKKKIVHAAEQDRPDVQLLRWHYRHLQGELEPERLWFFDESGLNLSMHRAYGRAPRGSRVVGKVPKNWGDNQTLIAGIGLGGVLCPMLLRGSLTGAIFQTYIAEVVTPQLRPGDTLVLDNLSAHKTQAVQQSVHAAGASLLYLPPYSPDLNPIELAWAKVKTWLRGRGARTVDDLIDALAAVLRNITSQDLRGWIKHCGYKIN